MLNGPVKTLALIAPWRLELDAVASVLTWVAIVAYVVVGATFGEAGVVIALWITFGVAALVIAGLIVRSLVSRYLPQKDPTAECRHQAAQWAAKGK